MAFPTRSTGLTAFASQGHNLLSSSDGCTGFGAQGDAIASNPRIAQLASNGGPTQTVALRAGSPAIGAARLGTAPGIDQRGRVRNDPDIGAFERLP